MRPNRPRRGAKKSHLGWMHGRVEAERDKSTIGEATSYDLQNPHNQGSL
jgi:hypothetical protein